MDILQDSIENAQDAPMIGDPLELRRLQGRRRGRGPSCAGIGDTHERNALAFAALWRAALHDGGRGEGNLPRAGVLVYAGICEGAQPAACGGGSQAASLRRAVGV